MAKKRLTVSPYLINLLLVILTSYCLIKYTVTMEQNPVCRQVETDQRKFLYWAGVFTLANIIVAFLFRLL